MYTNGMLAIAYGRAADFQREASRNRDARVIALAARQRDVRARRTVRRVASDPAATPCTAC
jgi:hypothetical protein